MHRLGVQISPVASRRDIRAFLDLPHRLYADDPHWVPPIRRDVSAFLSGTRHPFSKSGSVTAFLARQGDRVVGRIAAIENRAHNAYHKDRTAFFGFFEAENDLSVSEALVNHVTTWAKERGFETLRGPMSPSTNYECGLLYSGDPGPPVVMMPHNPPYYRQHLESLGFEKAHDLYAFFQDAATSDIARWARIAEKIRERSGVTVRAIDLSRFRKEVELIVDIYHDAWRDNWGFVPINPDEVDRLARELRPLILPWLGHFLIKDGREVAFLLALPDYNRVLIRHRGRLTPLLIFRLLRSRKRLPFMRLHLMGVRKELQHLGLDVLLYDEIVRECLQHGITKNESSWILESNTAMVNTLERVGAKRYRTYRIFDRRLINASASP